MFEDFTDFLPAQAIAAGFRLFLDRFGQHLVFGGKDLKRFPVDKYPLKVIQRYCRLYLRKVNSS